jgi:hypothetical protein
MLIPVRILQPMLSRHAMAPVAPAGYTQCRAVREHCAAHLLAE